MQEVTYVDRDRAAAVTIGSKDIKNDLRGKIKHSKSLGCLLLLWIYIGKVWHAMLVCFC